MAHGPFAKLWTERCAPELVPGAACRFAGGLFDEVVNYDVTGTFSPAAHAGLKVTLLQLFRDGPAAPTARTTASRFSSADLTTLRTVLNVLAASKILDATEAEFVTLRRDLAAKADQRALEEEAEAVAVHALTAASASEARRTADAMVDMQLLQSKPHVAAHKARLAEINEAKLDTGRLRQDLADLALKGEIEQGIWCLMDAALRQPSTPLKDSDLVRCIAEFVSSGGNLTQEALNTLVAASGSESDKKWWSTHEQAGHSLPLIMASETGKLAQLRAIINQAVKEHLTPAQGLLEEVSGGRAPTALPFVRAAQTRALRMTKTLLKAPHEDEVIRSDVLDVRRLAEATPQGGSARQLGEPEEPEQRVEYWVNLYDHQGNVALRADFAALANVIIELRRSGEITRRAMSRLHAKFTELHIRAGSRRHPPRGGAIDAPRPPHQPQVLPPAQAQQQQQQQAKKQTF